MVERIPELVFVKDADYRIVFGNSAFMSVYPREMHDRVIGYTTVEEYSPEQAEAFLANDRLAFETGRSEVIETVDMPDGTRRTFSTRKYRFESSAGEPFILGLATEITQMLDWQEALARSEERYALAVEGASVGLWDWRMDTEEFYWSPRHCEIVGVDPETHVPNFDDILERLHPDDREPVLQALDYHLRHRTAFDTEYRMRRGDDRYVWIHARGQAVWDESGEPVRMAGSVDDISARHAAEAQLRQINERLEEFAHVASHDLKEPLRGISSQIQFLIEDHQEALPDAAMARLARTLAMTERMYGQLDDLLRYSRASQPLGKPAHLEVGQIAREVAQLFEERAATRVAVSDELPQVTADPADVRTILQNLVVNGLKYNTSECAEVEIGCRWPSDSTRETQPVLFVRDNGIGIEEDLHEEVFRVFNRLHRDDEFGGGNGMGLTLVRRVVERNGGRIWIDSTPGSGTTFYFTLGG